ncbi:MAG: glutamate--tRNA ligase family protein, partial [bacterium]|nr:glutamate--tRNA ligase family protein [bacterium]
MIKNPKIRVRFAPSPTGFLHVGGLRTALFNYLFAKKYKGQFLLRIEDTDRERLVEGSEEDIKSSLKFFGLNWEEEYKQSERLAKYKEYADQLVISGKAYAEESEKGTALRFRVKTEGVTEFNDIVHKDLEFRNETFKDPVILKSDGYQTYN